MPNARWSDVMPEIDLPGGCTYIKGHTLHMVPIAGSVKAQPWLEAPHNLGFVLRWLERHGPPTWQEGSHYGAYQAELQSILMRWLLGSTLNDDMEVIARACAEVQGS